MRNKFPQYSLLNNSSDPYNDVYVAHLYSIALELRTHFCRLTDLEIKLDDLVDSPYQTQVRDTMSSPNDLRPNRRLIAFANNPFHAPTKIVQAFEE